MLCGSFLGFGRCILERFHLSQVYSYLEQQHLSCRIFFGCCFWLLRACMVLGTGDERRKYISSMVLVISPLLRLRHSGGGRRKLKYKVDKNHTGRRTVDSVTVWKMELGWERLGLDKQGDWN